MGVDASWNWRRRIEELRMRGWEGGFAEGDEEEEEDDDGEDDGEEANCGEVDGSDVGYTGDPVWNRSNRPLSLSLPLSPSTSPSLEISLTGELSIEDASDMILSSLIFVCSRLHDGSGSGSGNGFAQMADADLEYGESSMGVTLMRDEGESKD
jgi:hypothetical protein